MRTHAFMRMKHVYMKRMRLAEGDLVLAAECNLLGAPWALMVSSQVVEWHRTRYSSHYASAKPLEIGVHQVTASVGLLWTPSPCCTADVCLTRWQALQSRECRQAARLPHWCNLACQYRISI